jgi:hypothetical protein
LFVVCVVFLVRSFRCRWRWDWIIEGDVVNRVSVGPGENKFWVADGDGMFFGASDFVYAVNDGFGHGEFSETATGDLFDSVE